MITTLEWFVQHLREKRYFKINQVPFIDSVIFYTEPREYSLAVIYRVLLKVREEMFNKARKVGLKAIYNTIPENFNDFQIISPPEFDIGKAKHIIRYNFTDRNFK